MTPQEAIDYIENYTWSTTRLGLDRTRELLGKLGDPQKGLKFIHVTGSNGKGSTCAMLASIFEQAGYRVGLYISPYIEEFCERIQINGVNIPGERLAEITERVKDIAEGMEDHPSQFELVTAIGMIYFLEEKVDIVMLEVGMGGALDSTNVIDPPEVAIITNIGLEHTEYLGDTVEKIAKTKAGIIKPGCHCVCYDGLPEVTEVIKEDCAEKGVPLTCVDFSKLEFIEETLEGQRFLWEGKELTTKLLGPHQLHNTAVVLETVAAMRERGWKISDEDVKKGLANTRWPARFEVLGKEPLFILDGGHNPQCAEALAESIKKTLGGRKVVFLMGVLADKDYKQIVDIIRPYAKEFVCLTPFSGRALDKVHFAEYLESVGLKASVADDVESGIKLAEALAGKKGCIIGFGSLYIAGYIRGEYKRLKGLK